jgi:HK97 family phage major capsid protein/HK97 family phage prohead protease
MAMSESNSTETRAVQAAAAMAPGARGQRALQFNRESVDEDARTVVLAFASETPYERYWGVETLEISKKAIELSRLLSGANLLCDHDTRDVVGVIESVEIGADKKARAVIRFGRSERAEEIFRDVADGIRRNVSVGYLIHEAVLVETKDGKDFYLVKKWEPYEISLVSVPADASVGVGRSASPAAAAPAPALPNLSKKESAMSDTQNAAPAAAAPAAVQVVETRNHAAEIGKIAAALPALRDLALSAIQSGQTVEQFQQEAIRSLASRPVPTADIGLTSKEAKRFSVVRAIHALANPQDQSARRAAAFEFEASSAVGAKLGKAARGFFMPSEVQKRDLTVGTAADGGNLVATDLLSGSFIDLLRNAMVIDRMGAVMLSGLVGQIAIPRQSGSATAYWVAENSAPTESQQTIGQVTMSPKTIGAFTDISRRLTLQSSLDVEAMVNRDLATVLGLGIQQAAINGSGSSNQPSGILAQVTTSVIGGTNGAAPTWANIIKLETDVAVGNADVGTLGYLTNAKVRGKLKGTEKFGSTNGMPVYEARAGITNAVPSNLTKGTSSGVCSAIIYGNFADLVIGMWGGLDITVDPYTGSAAGTIRVVALQDVDIALRNAASFATMIDALTT